MKFRLLITLLITLGLVMAPAPVHAQGTPECTITNTEAALKFMLTLQTDEGGFSNGFAPESDLGATADAIWALAAIGQDAALLTKGTNTPLSYLESQVKAGKVVTAGQLGKVVIAVLSAQQDPTRFADTNLIRTTVETLGKDLDASGFFGQALALWALGMAQAEAPEGAVARLLAAADDKGGWAFAAGQQADTNTTALVVLAMHSIGKGDEVEKALNFLRALQNEDKGWPYQNPSQFGTDSDANSTALVVLALAVAGEALADYGDPHKFLATFQLPDGAFTYQLKQPAPSFLATVAALPALCLSAEPMLPTPQAAPGK